MVSTLDLEADLEAAPNGSNFHLMIMPKSNVNDRDHWRVCDTTCEESHLTNDKFIRDKY